MLPTATSGIEQGRTPYIISQLYSRSPEWVNGRGFRVISRVGAQVKPAPLRKNAPAVKPGHSDNSRSLDSD